MTYTGGTCNMLNHLRLKHSSDDLYEETELSLYKRERCDPNVNPLKVVERKRYQISQIVSACASVSQYSRNIRSA